MCSLLLKKQQQKPKSHGTLSEVVGDDNGEAGFISLCFSMGYMLETGTVCVA